MHVLIQNPRNAAYHPALSTYKISTPSNKLNTFLNTNTFESLQHRQAIPHSLTSDIPYVVDINQEKPTRYFYHNEVNIYWGQNIVLDYDASIPFLQDPAIISAVRDCRIATPGQWPWRLRRHIP